MTSRLASIVLFSVGALLATQAQAQFCPESTACITASPSHYTFAAMPYPYTEDITSTTAFVTLNGPSSAWTTIDSGCNDLNGFNLNGSQAFNALLRANVNVQSATAATGARYELQLIIDGQEHGWFVRRLRGKYPQADTFASTAVNLPAGSHRFSVQIRLIDSGSITVNNTWMTAQGSPTSNPGGKNVNPNAVTINSSTYTPLTNAITFTNSQAVDLAVQGYIQVNSGTPGQVLLVVPYLDGVRKLPRSAIAVPPLLYDGMNILGVVTNVPPGTHTLAWYIATGGTAVNVSYRDVDFVSFPASGAGLLLSTTGTSTLIDSATTGSQPTALESACGLWTKLLEGTIPPDPTTYNHVYQGYLRMIPPSNGPTWGVMSFETLFPGVGTDGGNRHIQVPTNTEGAFMFGDAALWVDNTNTETIRLWARKVNPACDGPVSNGLQGSFSVSDSWIWVKHTPVNACLYR